MAENGGENESRDQRSVTDIILAIDRASKGVIPRTKLLEEILAVDRKFKEQGMETSENLDEYLTRLGQNGAIQRALRGRERKSTDPKQQEEIKRLRELLHYPKEVKENKETGRRALLTGLLATGASLAFGQGQGEGDSALRSTTYTEKGKVIFSGVSPAISAPPLPVSAPATEFPDTIVPTVITTKIPATPEVKVPTRKERIHYPEELTYDEVRPWIGKMRNSHEAILSESLYTRELGEMKPEIREKVLDAIVEAHVQALMSHYGDSEAIIGLDPGHGGGDIGSGTTKQEDGQRLSEKDLTWDVTQRIADKLFDLSNGKYHIVFLRPENPVDEDLDGDGIIAPVERIQKRKAQLLKMEQEIRKHNLQEIGKNIVYLSIHFNGSPNGENDPSAYGTEVYFPNNMAMKNDFYRKGSEGLARDLQKELLQKISSTGYNPKDLSAKADPDMSEPLDNSDSSTGPYNVLSSPKLDRDLYSKAA